MKKRVKFFLEHRYTKFAIGGTIVFLFEWLLTILLAELFYFDPNIAYIFSLMLGMILLFSFHERITFRVNYIQRSIMLKKFVWLYTLFYLINWFLVYSFSTIIHYIILIPLVTILLSAILYPINKHWIFQC